VGRSLGAKCADTGSPLAAKKTTSYVGGGPGLASKFNPDTCQAIAESVFDGLSIADAAREANVNVKTVKNWLSRGRREGDGPYADFAEAVDRARQEATEREKPMDEADLRLVVSRAAKNGSVAAQKLYWEMLRAADDDPEESEDPFDRLDGPSEIEKARKKREAA
jgi:transposase